MRPSDLIVFTDLDGTLLDHDTYRFDAAMPALKVLKAHNIPLILASSKTAAEIAPLRDELGFSNCPAIVENGAGLLPAGETGTNAATQYDALRDAIDQVPHRTNFTGFGDMTAQDIAGITGLSLPAAARAAQRQFSEPGLWSGDAAGKATFVAALAKTGIYAQQGGRFLTLSFGGTKADRMAQISLQLGKSFKVALGDAANDIPMLKAASLGIVIANPAHAPLPPLGDETTGRIIRSQGIGPAGWNTEILRFLTKLDTKQRGPNG